MQFDYSKLRGRITEKVGTQSELSRLTGISEHTLSLKLKGRFGWKQIEILKICKVLEIPFEQIPVYFFAPRVQKTELMEGGE